jgi:hypothetical protein
VWGRGCEVWLGGFRIWIYDKSWHHDCRLRWASWRKCNYEGILLMLFYLFFFLNQDTLLKTNPAQDVLNRKANGTTHQPKQRLQQQHIAAVTQPLSRQKQPKKPLNPTPPSHYQPNKRKQYRRQGTTGERPTICSLQSPKKALNHYLLMHSLGFKHHS